MTKERYVAEYSIIQYLVDNPSLSHEKAAKALKIPEYLIREVALRLSKVEIYYWISPSGESYRICDESGELP